MGDDFADSSQCAEHLGNFRFPPEILWPGQRCPHFLSSGVCRWLPASTALLLCLEGRLPGLPVRGVFWLKQHVGVPWASDLGQGSPGPALHHFVSHHFLARRTLDLETKYLGCARVVFYWPHGLRQFTPLLCGLSLFSKWL